MQFAVSMEIAQPGDAVISKTVSGDGQGENSKTPT
jgi:hypothetical protein